jgi:hypothetical protein
VQWVLLSYRLPREPSTPRIALWRRLKKLGALQIGDGLSALPLDERTREQFDWLASDVEQNGGEAVVWIAEPGSKSERRTLETKLLVSIAADYRSVAAAADAGIGKGAAGRRRSLRRLRRQFEEISARDYLGSPERRRAEMSLERLRKIEEVVR